MEAAKNTPPNMALNKGRCVAWNVSVIAAVGICDLSAHAEKKGRKEGDSRHEDLQPWKGISPSGERMTCAS